MSARERVFVVSVAALSAACGQGGSSSPSTSMTPDPPSLYGAYVPAAGSVAAAEYRALVFTSDSDYFSYQNDCSGVACRAEGTYGFDDAGNLVLQPSTGASETLPFEALQASAPDALHVDSLVSGTDTTLVTPSDAGPLVDTASIRCSDGSSTINRMEVRGALMTLVGADAADGGAPSDAFFCDPAAASTDCTEQGADSATVGADGSCTCVVETDAVKTTAPHQFTNPLLGATPSHETTQCPDPNVRKVGDHDYWMVCTHDGGGQAGAFPIRHSTDLVNWDRKVTYAFEPTRYPTWALPPGDCVHSEYWAPEIYQDGNRWLMVFAATLKTAHPDDLKKHSMAIGIATADNPRGPWTSTSEPLASQGDGSLPPGLDGSSGRIDATLLVDPDTGALYHDETGALVLYYVYQPEYVHMARIDPSKLTVVPASTKALTLSAAGAPSFGGSLPWEIGGYTDAGKPKYTVEGVEAHWIKGNDGQPDEFILLYSGASTWHGTYAVGAARAKSPEGPFTKRPSPLLDDSDPKGKLVGPGHTSQWVRGPGKDSGYYILYHTQFRGHLGHTQPRVLNLSRVTFDQEGWPQIGDGHPTEQPQTVP